MLERGFQLRGEGGRLGPAAQRRGGTAERREREKVERVSYGRGRKRNG